MVGKVPGLGRPHSSTMRWATWFTALANCLKVNGFQPSAGSDDRGTEKASRCGSFLAMSSITWGTSRRPKSLVGVASFCCLEAMVSARDSRQDGDWSLDLACENYVMVSLRCLRTGFSKPAKVSQTEFGRALPRIYLEIHSRQAAANSRCVGAIAKRVWIWLRGSTVSDGTTAGQNRRVEFGHHRRQKATSS
ncbi:hypothetical protein F4780DRAFT_661452 [Xylariomycetidae sp. FL0641]|nr:hypothetical protein F4780DRAFT_661452 [Xylariomycetidae sp. FL0641]